MTPLKNCARCGSFFSSLRKYRVEKRYCSERCRKADEQKRWREKNKERIRDQKKTRSYLKNQNQRKQTILKKAAKIEDKRKICSTCNVLKDKAEFVKRRSALDGRSSQCKQCTKAYNQTDKTRELNRLRYYRNRDRYLEKKRLRYKYEPKQRKPCIDCGRILVKHGTRCIECYKKYKKSRKAPYNKQYAIAYRKRICNELTDGYIKSLIRNQVGIKYKEIENKDVELKRATIKLKRLINEKQRDFITSRNS